MADPMEESGACCEIARLPADLVSAAIALTATPRDAARAAAVSRAFRAAADSDAVWSRYLPRDLPPLAAGEDPPPSHAPAPPPSSKERFLRLSDPARAALLADGPTSVWLDRGTGAKCFMLSARALHISWGDTPRYWRWIRSPQPSRFPEAAELVSVWWLAICGKIDSNMLSQDSNYAAYIVFEITDDAYGLSDPPQDAAITVADTASTRKVCLDYRSGAAEHSRRCYSIGRANRGHRQSSHRDAVRPKERADGWMELELVSSTTRMVTTARCASASGRLEEKFRGKVLFSRALKLDQRKGTRLTNHRCMEAVNKFDRETQVFDLP